MLASRLIDAPVVCLERLRTRYGVGTIGVHWPLHIGNKGLLLATFPRTSVHWGNYKFIAGSASPNIYGILFKDCIVHSLVLNTKGTLSIW